MTTWTAVPAGFRMETAVYLDFRVGAAGLEPATSAL